jgi:hypothetical protein
MRKVALIITLICLAQTSFAGSDFAKKHPRRAEVNRRANREEAKNNEAAQEGKITQQQANKLNKEDEAIKAQQRADAAANGGHITKQEQRDLNREENRVNRQRRRMENRDAQGGGAPAAAPANGSGN